MTDPTDERAALLARLAELDADNPLSDVDSVEEDDVTDEDNRSVEDRVQALEDAVKILGPVIEYHRNR